MEVHPDGWLAGVFGLDGQSQSAGGLRGGDDTMARNDLRVRRDRRGGVMAKTFPQAVDPNDLRARFRTGAVPRVTRGWMPARPCARSTNSLPRRPLPRTHLRCCTSCRLTKSNSIFRPRNCIACRLSSRFLCSAGPVAGRFAECRWRGDAARDVCLHPQWGTVPICRPAAACRARRRSMRAARLGLLASGRRGISARIEWMR